jgi:hypothetical protein
MADQNYFLCAEKLCLYRRMTNGSSGLAAEGNHGKRRERVLTLRVEASNRDCPVHLRLVHLRRIRDCPAWRRQCFGTYSSIGWSDWHHIPSPLGAPRVSPWSLEESRFTAVSRRPVAMAERAPSVALLSEQKAPEIPFFAARLNGRLRGPQRRTGVARSQ